MTCTRLSSTLGGWVIAGPLPDASTVGPLFPGLVGTAGTTGFVGVFTPCPVAMGANPFPDGTAGAVGVVFGFGAETIGWGWAGADGTVVGIIGAVGSTEDGGGIGPVAAGGGGFAVGGKAVLPGDPGD